MSGVILTPAVPTVLLIVDAGENVTMKSRSIAKGITTGTIGTTAMKK